VSVAVGGPFCAFGDLGSSIDVLVPCIRPRPQAVSLHAERNEIIATPTTNNEHAETNLRGRQRKARRDVVHSERQPEIDGNARPPETEHDRRAIDDLITVLEAVAQRATTLSAGGT
jgi:hypothetical protein